MTTRDDLTMPSQDGRRRLYIGTAGWSIPRLSAPRFVGPGTHLQRYARAMPGAEINSSFYREHAATTYAKWRGVTPPGFQFSVKVPRIITHDLKLRRSRAPFARLLEQVAGLGDKLGPLLVQLPPSLAFDARVAANFFTTLRSAYGGRVVCEPRHPSWFAPSADALLARHRISRVVADPPLAPEAIVPGGWSGLVYFRLHGSPRPYWSAYSDEYIAALAAAVNALPLDVEVWCVFDNTASGAAIENAWHLQRLFRGGPRDKTEGAPLRSSLLTEHLRKKPPARRRQGVCSEG